MYQTAGLPQVPGTPEPSLGPPEPYAPDHQNHPLDHQTRRRGSERCGTELFELRVNTRCAGGKTKRQRERYFDPTPPHVSSGIAWASGT